MPFAVKYPRPQVLTNDECCFNHNDVDRILQMRDEELGWREYCTLFTISRCVGTYEEVVYFLPLALEYVLSGAEDSIECTGSIINFVSVEADQLERDDLLEPSRELLRAWFETWIREFKVDRSTCDCDDADECHIYYYLPTSSYVDGHIGELITYRTHTDLAEELIRSLAEQHGDPVRSAWLLEYAKNCRQRFHVLDHKAPDIDRMMEEALGGDWGDDPLKTSGISISDAFESMRKETEAFHGPNALCPVRDSEYIHGVIMNQELLQRHWDEIKHTPVARDNPEAYWTDLVEFLGLRW